VTSNPDFKVTILFNGTSKTVPDRTILTMANQQKVVYGLSNDAIFLEQPLTHFSRYRYSLTLNMSKAVKNTVIVTMEGE